MKEQSFKNDKCEKCGVEVARFFHKKELCDPCEDKAIQKLQEMLGLLPNGLERAIARLK